MRKDKGVSVKVSEDFYRKMEALRLQLRNKHKIKVSSHIKLTKMLAQNKGLFQNKSWLAQMRKWNGY